MLIALIPAYNPVESLPEYIINLKAQNTFQHIVVINDGSLSHCDPIFRKVAALAEVQVLKHAVNQGKGAALKAGLNYIACQFKDLLGVVTIDADGQHSIQDACRVAQTLKENKNTLIIGGRKFDHGTPMRSFLGNFFTRYFFRILIGSTLYDTQSGLRGLPASMISDLLTIEANGYEFELDMLMRAGHWGIPIKEILIETIYLDGNKKSSFRPLWDSLRIYFVLFRFSIIAILSALIDYGVFICIYLIHPSVFFALVGGRTISTTFNYLSVRRYAFRTHMSHWKTLPKYLFLVCFSGGVAWTLIMAFMNLLGWHVVAAKVAAEVIMFIVNFLIQRDFIFKRT